MELLLRCALRWDWLEDFRIFRILRSWLRRWVRGWSVVLGFHAECSDELSFHALYMSCAFITTTFSIHRGPSRSGLRPYYPRQWHLGGKPRVGADPAGRLAKTRLPEGLVLSLPGLEQAKGSSLACLAHGNKNRVISKGRVSRCCRGQYHPSIPLPSASASAIIVVVVVVVVVVVALLLW